MRLTSYLHRREHAGRSTCLPEAQNGAPCGSLGILLLGPRLPGGDRARAARPIYMLTKTTSIPCARARTGDWQPPDHLLAVPSGGPIWPWSRSEPLACLQRSAHRSSVARPSLRVRGKLPQPCLRQRRSRARAARARSRPLRHAVNRAGGCSAPLAHAAAMAHLDENGPELSGSGASRPRSTRWSRSRGR